VLVSRGGQCVWGQMSEMSGGGGQSTNDGYSCEAFPVELWLSLLSGVERDRKGGCIH
jgi:hypothetical protein